MLVLSGDAGRRAAAAAVKADDSSEEELVRGPLLGHVSRSAGALVSTLRHPKHI